MTTLSYTSSPYLLKEVGTVDTRKNSTLLTLVSPKEEIRLRWEILIERIVNALKIEGMYVKNDEVSKVLTSSNKKFRRKHEFFIVNYKRSHDYIRYNWTYNKEIVSANDFLTLYAIFNDRVPFAQKDLKAVLSFLQFGSEHPLIQAGTSYVMMSYLLSNSDNARTISLLTVYLFLYKNGYDFRGLLNLEEYFFEHAKAFSDIVQSSYKQGNISGYLDHYILALSTSAENTLKRIQQKDFRMIIPQAFFELTERQRQILMLLDEPGGKITNRSVQKHFRVSQITSSRDLARLASLGLLFAAGRGRSVYYTKA